MGLRIEELLSITPDNITTNNDHINIHFTDFKNSNPRDVVLMDKKAISLLQLHLILAGDKVFDISADRFNRYLKKLAGLAFKEKRVSLYDADKDKNQPYFIKDVITSHCIRRYAIINNIDKYGIDVARAFSGHTN